MAKMTPVPRKDPRRIMGAYDHIVLRLWNVGYVFDWDNAGYYWANAQDGMSNRYATYDAAIIDAFHYWVDILELAD